MGTTPTLSKILAVGDCWSISDDKYLPSGHSHQHTDAHLPTNAIINLRTKSILKWLAQEYSKGSLFHFSLSWQIAHENKSSATRRQITISINKNHITLCLSAAARASISLLHLTAVWLSTNTTHLTSLPLYLVTKGLKSGIIVQAPGMGKSSCVTWTFGCR